MTQQTSDYGYLPEQGTAEAAQNKAAQNIRHAGAVANKYRDDPELALLSHGFSIVPPPVQGERPKKKPKTVFNPAPSRFELYLSVPTSRGAHALAELRISRRMRIF